jgi:site-specific DNA-methyltransferase (adenine-specific)
MFEFNRLYNTDCMEAMREMADGCFDLAIVDPPYGGACSYTYMPAKNVDGFTVGPNFEIYAIKASASKGVWGEDRISHGHGKNKAEKWDDPPPVEYFRELFRVSKNQVIWGGNNFPLPPTKCFIVWEKTNIPENFSMSMCEYAWTSFTENAKIFKFNAQSSKTNVRIHPTQKPAALYK